MGAIQRSMTQGKAAESKQPVNGANMSTVVSFGRLKRHPGGHPAGSRQGGNVVQALRSGAHRRPPAEGDTALVRQALLLQLALKALDRIIADYGGLTQRRPSYAALARYLEDLERGPQPAPARATDAPSRGSSTTETPALLQPQPPAAAG